MTPNFFFLRLIPPRPTFALDMTAAERDLMVQHAIYVRGFFDSGQVLAYGPVLDPEGAFGIAILAMRDLAEAEQFIQQDPAIQAGLCRYLLHPMHLAAAQAHRLP